MSISAEVDRLVELANTLLDLEELTSGRAAPMDSQHVADILHRVADRHRQSLFALDRDVVVDAPDDLVAVANPRWIEAALDNLVANATRYGAGTVTLRAARGGPDAAEISVEDQGDGFPDEFLDHAFERFARAEASRTGRGAGLGLALVRAVCAAHSGQARIDQSPGRTTVTMTLRSEGFASPELSASTPTGAELDTLDQPVLGEPDRRNQAAPDARL